MELRNINSIDIDGIDYSVSIVSPSTQMEPLVHGDADFTNCRIRILDSNERYMYQTMWHEILHVINLNRLDDELTECQINAIATGICQVLFSNIDIAMFPAISGIEFTSSDQEDDADDAEEDEDE